MRFRVSSLFAFALAIAGCSSGGDTTGTSSSGSGGTGGAGGDPTVSVGDRSASVHVPPGYDPSTPAPLVVMLHGYSVNGFLEEVYLDLTPLSDEHGFLYVHPDGTLDQSGVGFWNADDACCNYYGSTVDDSTFLSSLITEIESKFAVDPKRVYLVGHSNGGFMAYRVACEHADQIAAVVSLAGAMPIDPSTCQPSAPVSVLQAHGTKDDEVLFDGFAGDGTPGNGPYPSAQITAADWAAIDGCATPPVMEAPLDVDGHLPGAETTVDRYQGCKSGIGVELWTIQDGTHIPDIGSTFREGIVQFLLDHPKP